MYLIMNSALKWLISNISTIIATLALIATVYTSIVTAKNNKNNNFDNLFFHLISLLNKVISSNENSSDEIKTTLDKIKTKSQLKLNKLRTDEIKSNYKRNEPFLNDVFTKLDNLYLDWEQTKLQKIKNNPSTLDSKRIPIRKPEFLDHITNLSDINLSERSSIYYSYYKGDTENTDSNYPDDVLDNQLESLLIITNFNNNPVNAIDLIFNSEGNNTLFNSLISDIQKKFPDKASDIGCWKEELFEMFHHETMEMSSEISETEKKEIIEKILLDNKHGIYFRTVHRILKIILDFSNSDKVINKYCGILRTQLSENHLMILFYNAQYTDRGKKFKSLVKKMNLWGDKEELDTSINSDTIHFATSNLIWKDTDLNILKDEYVRNSSYV
ncbi:hypothetical protein C0213_03395 [Latilactobacillus sakei]|nr:hypothetical protein C0213_03395 [Latilactobacillus sakei]